MARVSIFYDDKIKEQVFMIRGDERYARSTKVVMELGSLVSQDTYGFTYEAHINVLRDVEGSSIVVYDNDDVIYVVDDWQSTDSGITIELPALAWEAEHNLQAKYIGNGRCSPSVSKVIHMDSIPNPNKIDAPLTIQIGYPEIGDLSTFCVRATFNILNKSDTVNQPIKFYLDGEYVDTVNIDSESYEAVQLFSNVPDGLHTLKAEFEGSLFLYSKSATQSVSVGKKLTILSQPSYFIAGDTVSFEIRLTDYFDNVLPSNPLNVSMQYDNNGSWQVLDYGTTDNDGFVTFSATVPASIDNNSFNFRDGYQNVLGSVQLPFMTPSTLTMASSSDYLFSGKRNTITVNIGQNKEGVPINISEVTETYVGSGEAEVEPDVPADQSEDDINDYEYEVLSTDTIYTNTQGIATKTITGKGGMGLRIWKADLGTVLSKKMYLSDYLVFWDKLTSSKIQEGDFERHGTLFTLNTVYRMDSPSNSDIAILRLPEFRSNKAKYQPYGQYSYSIVILGITTPKDTRISLGIPKGVTSETNADVVINNRKYTDGQVILQYNMNTRTSEYWIYNNNQQVAHSSKQGFIHPSVGFSNNYVGQQQANFKLLTFTTGEE